MRAIVLDQPGRFRAAQAPDPTPGPGTDRRPGGLLRGLRHGPAHHGRRVPADPVPDHPRPRVLRHGRGRGGRCQDRPAGRRPGGGGPVAVLRVLPALPVRPRQPVRELGGHRRHRGGAFAEYVAVPAVNAHRLPDGIDGQAGAMVEPLACAVHGLRRLGPVFGDTVVLTGAGTMGLLLLQLLVHAGAGPVTVVDRVSDRLEVARKLGRPGSSATSASSRGSGSRSRSTRAARRRWSTRRPGCLTGAGGCSSSA